jgi:hypothetical protein
MMIMILAFLIAAAFLVPRRKYEFVPKFYGTQHASNSAFPMFFLFNYCIFTIYSRYLKRVISKRDGCEYLKQVPSIDG